MRGRPARFFIERAGGRIPISDD